MKDDPKMYVDVPNQEIFDQITGYHAVIKEAALEFLADKGKAVPVSADDKQATYTSSSNYFLETYKYHQDVWVQAFLTRVILGSHEYHDVVDAGCAFGVTGLCLAMAGKTVTFHDFEGLGLSFLRWFGEREKGLGIKVVPYGEYIKKHSMVVAFDVLEHTSRHLSALRWLRDLGHLVAFSYPCRVGRVPPYEPEGLDEWVDDEAIMTILQHRHQVFYTSRQFDWRCAIFG